MKKEVMFAKINLRILSAKERALLNAVSDEDLAKVKTLVVEDNVNINIRDSLERSPLMRTSFVADNEAREGMTKIFLRNGAEPNMVDLHGRSALMLACREENKEDMVKLLMECTRTDPNLQDEDGNTALIQAIEIENVPVVRTLLTEDYSHRVDVNVENFESKTAIVIAAKLKNKEICALLTSTSNVNLSDVPNHLIEFLPDEFQYEAKEAKDKEKESRSSSSKGTPTDMQGDVSQPSSPKPNESMSSSSKLNPQTETAADGTKDEVPLERSIPPSVADEEETPQRQQNGRSSTSSNILTPQNGGNVDDTEANLRDDNVAEPNQQDSKANKDSKLEAERPASNGLVKESPTGRRSRASSEDKVVQKLDEDDQKSGRAETQQEESRILKEKEGKEPANKMETRTDEIKEGVSGNAGKDGMIDVEKGTERASSNEKSLSKQTEKIKEGGTDAEDRSRVHKEEGRNGMESKLSGQDDVIHKSQHDDKSDQRRSSMKESSEDSHAKELPKTQESKDAPVEGNTESLQKTSNNRTENSEAKDGNTVERQHSVVENSSTEITANAVKEKKKTTTNSETRSKDRHNKALTKRSSKDELRKSDQGDTKSTEESNESKTNRPSQAVASDPAAPSFSAITRSSPNQSISAASFTSEPPPGVQRSPEKPRGWTAPAVATVPAAVNKWKKRAKERRGSKSYRKRPLRVEDQTPYVTKSGRVIYPNSVHDTKYEEIQEVRVASRMSRMDMTSQLMLRDNLETPQTHSAHPRRDARKISRHGSKNTIA